MDFDLKKRHKATRGLHVRMRNKKTDRKNIQLAKTLYELRQAIDIHRVIGLNVADLIDKPGKSFFAQCQGFSDRIISLNICKVYEFSERHPLNSISGIIASLPDRKYPASALLEVEQFCTAYGETRRSKRCVVMLRRTLCRFKNAHRRSLKMLKNVRDKHVAHSEYPARRRFLPSHAEFEALYRFGWDFYKLISGTFIKVGPALAGRHSEVSLLKLLEAIGLSNPKHDYDD